MLDISNTTQSAFKEPPGSVTAALVPAISMAPLAGGIAFARVGARFLVGGRAFIVRDAESVARKFPTNPASKGEKDGLKVVARCVGKLRNMELDSCGCSQAETVEALIAAHPDLETLKKRNEVHVLALWSDQAWDLEGYEKAKKRNEKFLKQLADLEDAGHMLDAQALRAKLGWTEKGPADVEREIVGLLIPSGSSGKWLHAHGDSHR